MIKTADPYLYTAKGITIMSKIRDIGLKDEGLKKISWVKRNMFLLPSLEEEFAKTMPFKGIRTAVSVHMEAKTAYLCLVLKAGGADVYATGSNPLSTQDDVAAALCSLGVNIFATHGCTAEEYDGHLADVLSARPNIIIDDGGDLVHMMHTKFKDYLPYVLGGCEETTTGIHRLKAMAAQKELKFPMIAVNDADCKHLFDNRYGTGQSVWDGINRTTNLLVAGKNVVVAGYGWCGKGVAMRAKGFGAKVIVTEVDPIRALEAHMDGFDVMSMDDAASLGDFFITVTGCRDVIRKEHFTKMKDNAILCNAGHFNVEINIPELEELSVRSFEARKNITGYILADGRQINLIAEGRLVNLAAGDGHPAEIMDMSFAIQAICAAYLVKNGRELTADLHKVPESIDREVAERLLSLKGMTIDSLTREQEQYLNQGL